MPGSRGTSPGLPLRPPSGGTLLLAGRAREEFSAGRAPRRQLPDQPDGDGGTPQPNGQVDDLFFAASVTSGWSVPGFEQLPRRSWPIVASLGVRSWYSCAVKQRVARVKTSIVSASPQIVSNIAVALAISIGVPECSMGSLTSASTSVMTAPPAQRQRPPPPPWQTGLLVLIYTATGLRQADGASAPPPMRAVS